jgi:PIN domain nuclease of toxin-antitoxin system
MKYLLDAHAFIWYDDEPARLSSHVFTLCEDKTNILFLSLVSVWEIQIKLQLGKLKLRAPLEKVIEEQQRENQIELLPIILPHIIALENLPQHHRDPFDRLLVAQAQIENIPVLSSDPILARYPIRVIW